MAAMKILIFAGSTRQQSHNRRLAAAATEIAREFSAQPTLLELSQFDIPMYNADLEARGTPADVLRLKEEMHSHPAWLICSPEYNGSYTALLKNTLDWASSPVAGHAQWADGTLAFRGKVVATASASPGGLGGLRSQAHLAALLLNLGCWVVPRSHAVGQAHEAFDEAGRLKSGRHLDGMRALLEQTLWATQRLGA
ncbi:NADPH-dependent FMN reductase [Comamonas composti]|uniref:NADPH-dependent FMN reductase n=1 Tax=Comamonas composti TaxID=408558 RepID=UPI00047EE367|nr:NAD(P)H-dependent oxidoreductase [Comamonas composti]